MPQNLERGDDAGMLQEDQGPADPSRSSAISRVQARTDGFVARHPAMLKVREWLGRTGPGEWMNP